MEECVSVVAVNWPRGQDNRSYNQADQGMFGVSDTVKFQGQRIPRGHVFCSRALSEDYGDVGKGD
jgi:hypothetical protein